MKNQVFATLSSLTLLTTAAAFGQSSAVTRFDIPFEFRIGAKLLPAGHYTVRPQVALNVLSIWCFECKAGALVLVGGIEARKTAEKGTLVFNKYNNTYFLSKVWTAGYSQGRELRKSKAEREFTRNNSPVPRAEVAVAQR